VIGRDLMLVGMIWFCVDARGASGFLPAHHDHPTVPLADRLNGTVPPGPSGVAG
jgi:hypothetical protein